MSRHPVLLVVWTFVRHPVKTLRALRDYKSEMRTGADGGLEASPMLSHSLRDIIAVHLQAQVDGQPHQTSRWGFELNGEMWLLTVCRETADPWVAASTYRQALVDAGLPVPHVPARSMALAAAHRPSHPRQGEE